jgi:CxxC-x17-CxxC domain-containing protein
MEEMRQKWMGLTKDMIHRAANIVNGESCTGDFIENSKNCLDCYDVNESQDSRYVIVGVEVKDNYDCSNMYIKPELCYEVLGTIEVYNCAYCLFVFHSVNLLYCEYCFNCKDCFGCVGLRRKQYCIFNKQYAKEEYETLVPKIIEKMKEAKEWGLYFPPSLSPFGYNESLAHEYLPLTEKEAKAQGFSWRTIREKKPEVKKMIPASRLPDRIGDIPDDILNWAILCEKSKRPFRIQKQELDFYRRQSLPVPHLHPDERYDRRLALRNPRKLWKRTCMKCGKEMQTTFAPERPEKVYCESCYLKEVY